MSMHSHVLTLSVRASTETRKQLRQAALVVIDALFPASCGSCLVLHARLKRYHYIASLRLEGAAPMLITLHQWRNDAKRCLAMLLAILSTRSCHESMFRRHCWRSGGRVETASDSIPSSNEVWLCLVAQPLFLCGTHSKILVSSSA